MISEKKSITKVGLCSIEKLMREEKKYTILFATGKYIESFRILNLCRDNVFAFLKQSINKVIKLGIQLQEIRKTSIGKLLVLNPIKQKENWNSFTFWHSLPSPQVN